jgi:hypothetical protein
MNAFISHSTADRPLAQKLAAALKKGGVEVFDLYADVYPGENWAERLSLALQEANAMVLLLTPGSLENPTLSYDLGYALGNERFKGRLFPVVAPDVRREEIPWILNRFRVFELRSHDPDEASLREITTAVANAA